MNINLYSTPDNEHKSVQYTVYNGPYTAGCTNRRISTESAQMVTPVAEANAFTIEGTVQYDRFSDGRPGFSVSGMKVYRLNDCDYYMAQSLDEAKSQYMLDTNLPDYEAFDDPYELDLYDMISINFVNEDGTNYTFADELRRRVVECFYLYGNGYTKPRLFASTEW